MNAPTYDFTDAVLLLCSAGASFTTGHASAVGGGMLGS